MRHHVQAQPIERVGCIAYLNNVSSSVTSTMKPAGLENSQGIITGLYLMDPTDHQWDGDPEMKMWRSFMAKYMPDANTGDGNYVYTYALSYLMEQTLKRCGDNLTRANLISQVASFHKFRVPLLLPGITVSTSPSDFYRSRRSVSPASRRNRGSCSASSWSTRAPEPLLRFDNSTA